MLCLSVKKGDFSPGPEEMIEFRFDLFESLDLAEVQRLRTKHGKPVIFTSRENEQIWELAKLSPDYLDLDHRLHPSFVKKIATYFPHVKVILSYHNYEKTPDDLEGVLKMLKRTPAALYKICCHATASSDALRMVALSQKESQVIALCMGDKGILTRLLSTPWSYVAPSVDEKTADGQLTAEECSLYNRQGKERYGLIGHNLAKRKSHLFHNRLMKELSLDALYLKIPLEDPEELPQFLSLCKKCELRGLSVTDPLKTHILSHLDIIDPQALTIGAVNTVVFRDQALFGFNTDGVAALDAIEKHGKVAGQKMTVVGAGGTGAAIAYEAHLRGAHVTLLNRTKERAQALAARFGIQSGGIEDLSSSDVLINTTPLKLPPTSSLSLDCDLLGSSPFSLEMWVGQATRQYALWRPDLNTLLIRKILENITLH